MKPTKKQIEGMRVKVLKTDNYVYHTKAYQYWLDPGGHLVRARLSDIDTMAMYEQDAIEVLD